MARRGSNVERHLRTALRAKSPQAMAVAIAAAIFAAPDE